MAHYASGEKPPRHWPRRLLIGVNVFLAACILATGSAYLYLKYNFSRVDTISLCKVLRNCGDDDPGRAMNVLMVGSDTRATLTADERKKFGSESQVGGQRSDTILVLHVDPAQEKASILSIPRDTYVDLAGTTRKGRINEAFENGPAQLITTIDQDFGIKIDHYVQVDFNGFRSIVNAIGGVTVYLPGPARDRKSGLRIDQGGCVPLNGEVALAYVRSRQYQVFESGRWRSDPSGDIGRIQRQQDFIRRVMRKAISRGVRNPITMNRLINAATKNVKIDQALSTKDIFRLGKRFRSLAPEAVEMLTLPGDPVRVGGASVLRVRQPDAQEVIDRFAGRVEPNPTAVPKIPPAAVRLRVLNGTGRGGQATEVARSLQRVGFNVADRGDARSFGFGKTEIAYASGQRDKALLLQAYLGGGATLKADPALRGVDLVVTTGSSFSGVRPAVGADAPTSVAPSTTLPRAAPKATEDKPKC